MHPHDLVQDLIACRDAQQQLLKVMNRTIQTAHGAAEAIDATFAELRDRISAIEGTAFLADKESLDSPADEERLLFP